MLKPFFQFLICGIMVMPSICMAYEATDSFGQTNVSITPKDYRKPKRPKAPSAQQIFCYYEDGSLTFDFAIPEGDCAVTVTNLSNNHVAAFTISSEDEAVIYVGELSHAYIELYTANGHEYEGYLE